MIYPSVCVKKFATPEILIIIIMNSIVVGHGKTIPIKHKSDGENVSLTLYSSNFPGMTQFLALMSYDHVTAIPIKHHGNYLPCW